MCWDTPQCWYKSKVTNIFTEKEEKHFDEGIPLGLNMFLIYVHDVAFKSLYITGVTFYQGSDSIDGCYDDKRYLIEQVRDRMIQDGKTDALDSVHSLDSNIRKTIWFCNNNEHITYCDELRDILSRWK